MEPDIAAGFILFVGFVIGFLCGLCSGVVVAAKAAARVMRGIYAKQAKETNS